MKLPILYYEKVSENHKLNYYLAQNIGRKYFLNDRQELIGKINLRRDGHLQRSIDVLNQCLIDNGIAFTLKKSVDNRKVYWTIEKNTDAENLRYL